MNKELESFIKYYEAYPDQRFWQSLRNWSGQPYILVAKELDFNTMEFKGIEDTFYWNDKQKENK